MRATRRRLSAAPLLVVAALGVGACGSSSSSSTTSSTPATTSTAPAAAQIVGKSTSVVLNPATAQILKASGITVSPIAPATAKKGLLVFPESGGQIVVATLAGTIQHTGGLTLSHGGKSVQLTNFVVNTTTKQITATVGGQSVPIFNLNLASVKRASGPNGTVLASNIALTLTPQAATVLSASLEATIPNAGLPFGIATLTVAVKA